MRATRSSSSRISSRPPGSAAVLPRVAAVMTSYR
jgi:hypothetical protein